MKDLKLLVSVFILLTFLALGVSAQALGQPSRTADRQVTLGLQRLERSSNRFRKSLNAALVEARIDETRPQNDISSFETAFASALISSGTNSIANRQARPTFGTF